MSCTDEKLKLYVGRSGSMWSIRFNNEDDRDILYESDEIFLLWFFPYDTEDEAIAAMDEIIKRVG